MEPIYSTSNGYSAVIDGELRSSDSLRELLRILEYQQKLNAALNDKFLQSAWERSFQS
jgi:hypothetical protein